MGIYAGGTAKPVTHQVIENKEHLLSFPKRVPPETNGIHWPRLTNLLMERIQKKPEG
jgi:3-oxoacyl-[acyl-carrier-protein] synthase-3